MDESANITLVPPTLPEPTEGAMYTVAEIARFFSVTENSIRRWCADGRLPYAKINGVMKQVHRSKDMSGDEKRAMLDKLTAQRNAVAKAVVDKAPAVAALMRQAAQNGAAQRKLAEHADD